MKIPLLLTPSTTSK
uniref:Uncharacterized protein n=1 Tax=Lepeophtheirus salmonis TaxID=72036 RepID=A0A0K2TN91_LEPSM